MPQPERDDLNPRRPVFILLYDDYAAGGMQRSAMALRDCLEERGYKVTIFCVTLTPGGLAEKNSFVRLITEREGSKALFWTRYLSGLRSQIRESEPETVIAFGLTLAVLLPIAAAALRRPLLIGSERTYPPLAGGPRKFLLLRKLLYPRLSYIVCQTVRTRDWFVGYLKLPADRFPVIPNVVERPPESFERRAVDSTTIVCVGRLAEEKRFDVALRAFAKIRAQLPEAKLKIAGEGPLEDELKLIAAALGVAESVDFVGPLPDLEPLWAKATMLLFTSRYEGFPNVLAEAMAHGVPAVAADCPTGPSEMIDHGVNGYLVPVGDAEAAAEASLRLLTDADHREAVGRAARTIADGYSAGRVGGLWEALIEGRGG